MLYQRGKLQIGEETLHYLQENGRLSLSVTAFHCALKHHELFRVVLTTLRDGRINSEQRPEEFSGM